MRSTLSKVAAALLLAGVIGLAWGPAQAQSWTKRGTLMYTYFCCPDQPRHAFPQYGPVFRGPGYEYWGPPTYDLGWRENYRLHRKDGMYATR